jgi:beta-galactosidase
MKLTLIAPLALLALGCGGQSKGDGAFPPGFLFGSAVAGFQVDMGCPTLPAEVCEDRASDWYAFVEAKLPSTQGFMSGQPVSAGPGHWELYEGDFDLAAGMKHNAFRMSLEWSRIFPTATDGIEGYTALRAVANEAALTRYHAMLAALKARGLKPLLTLNHYTLPSWIHDAVKCHEDLSTCPAKGWVDSDRTVREIARYAGFVAQEFGAEVDTWATLNEPLAVVLPGYVAPGTERANPPAVRLQLERARSVWVAMINAHARMYDAVKAADSVDADGDGVNASIGVVYATVPAVGRDPENRFDQRGAQNLFYLYNTAFLDAVIKGQLDPSMNRQPQYREDLAGRMDYLGINYYTRVTVEGTGAAQLPDFSPQTTFNPFSLQIWEDYPRGIYEMAMLAKGYGLPSIVTENGTADPGDDGTGPSYLVRHLTWVQRAIRDGADVRGYFYWTLLDNYEWNHGMDIRMGLYAVSKDDPSKRRTPRQAVGVYRQIVEAGEVPASLKELYPAPEE